MRLTENEKSLIYHNYRLAKDQANQIIIEAELNNCSIEDVKQILSERGEDVSQYNFSYSNAGLVEPKRIKKAVKKRNHGFRNNPVSENKAIELYRQGLNDREIAEIMKVSVVTIANWRHDNELRTHAAIKAEKETQERYAKVLELDKLGYSNKEIAKAIGMIPKTVENIKSKLKRELKKAAQLTL